MTTVTFTDEELSLVANCLWDRIINRYRWLKENAKYRPDKGILGAMVHSAQEQHDELSALHEKVLHAQSNQRVTVQEKANAPGID